MTLPRCRDCGFAPEYEVLDERAGYVCREGSRAIEKKLLRPLKPEDFGLPSKRRRRVLSLDL